MKIAIDAQPIIESQKTGIGFYEYYIITQMMKHWSGNDYILNYFKFRRPREAEAALQIFTEKGGKLNACTWLPRSAYRFLCTLAPVPYSLFFGGKADITLFFNFIAPPGAAGRNIIVVYDMAYLAFPETVRFRTKTMLDVSLKASVRRAAAIITISEFSKNEIVKYMGVSPERIAIAPGGVDTRVFYPVGAERINKAKKKYSIPDTYLLYAGTLEPRKNIERLIEAYAKLVNEEPSAPPLVLAGRKGWLYESIFEKVESLGMEKRVIFTGYIDDADMPAILSGAMIFVFPSLYEGFGMPPLEAMACGTPTLTSTSASLPEVVGDAAVKADPYNAEDIKDGMKRLINDSALRGDLSAKGLERAKQFNWERPARIIMDVCKNLLTDAKGILSAPSQKS
ncbi:MAG: glycosyltransferase family 4 protein [Clostridiales bacterium]|jgi:glycosyltransferase involved in cell wall biosynthesis|nr:glycosyltransferase family 4 protein [Clostridiales bacterium]